jgi:hypothetical protein
VTFRTAIPVPIPGIEKLWSASDERRIRDDEKYEKGVQQNHCRPVKIIG